MVKVDVVDDDDKVIDTASLEEIYKKHLSHRIVHVIIVNDKEELFLHLRAKDDLYCPSFWEVSISSYVDSGEIYEDIAKRETRNLGIKGTPDFYSKELFIDKNDPNKTKKFIEIYKLKVKGTPVIEIKNAQKAEFCSMRKVKKMIEVKEKFTPELLMVLKNYFRVDC